MKRLTKRVANKKEEMMYTVYSKDNCPHCVRAIAELEKRELPHQVVKLGQDIIDKGAFIDDIKAKVPAGTVIATVPQIFLNNAYIGGADDLMASL